MKVASSNADIASIGANGSTGIVSVVEDPHLRSGTTINNTMYDVAQIILTLDGRPRTMWPRSS